MNEIIFLCSIVVVFSSLVAVFRLFGKTGLCCWICFASVMANTIVIETVKCFGLTTTLGNVLFGSVFLAVDILTEVYDKKDANRAIFMGLAANIGYIAVSQVVLLFNPGEYDFASESFKVVFSMTPRVCAGSIVAYAFGNLLDVEIFSRFKKVHNEKLLWLRNNVSTLIAQLLDNYVLHIIAFLGVMTFKEVSDLSINVWILEIIITVFSTPFLYFAKKKSGVVE